MQGHDLKPVCYGNDVFAFGYDSLNDFVNANHASSVLTTNNFQTVGDIAGFTASPVPEPTTMLLLGTGLLGLAEWERKKFKK